MASFDPAVNVLSGGLGWLKYWWVFAILGTLLIIGAVVWYLTKVKQKKGQWSHELIIKIEAPDGTIDDKVEKFRMRRWKHKEKTTAPLYEMEKPLFGSRIFVELDKYSGRRSYELVLGIDGRLYLPKVTRMSKDKNALEVSVTHAGIDRTRQEYSNDFEKQHATPKKIDGLTLLKYGTYILIGVIILIIGLSYISKLPEKYQYEAQAASAEVAAWEAMGEVMSTVQANTNVQMLMLPEIEKIYGKNIQGAINNKINNLNNSNG